MATGTTNATPNTDASFSCDSNTARWHVKQGAQLARASFNIKHWRKGPADTNYRRHITCLDRKKDREAIQSHLKASRAHFRLYREYRHITPYRCQSGAYGTYAIPCYIVACESGYSWRAYNSSGAAGVYQIMPEWGRPFPADTFAAKMEHHRIAASLSLSNWVCA